MSCPPSFVVRGSKGMRVNDDFVVTKYSKIRAAKGTRVMAIDGTKPCLRALQRQGMTVPPNSFVRVAHVTRAATNLQDRAIEHATSHTGHAVLCGGPGTGKTVAYNKIAAREIARKRDVLCIAPTATAASRLPPSLINGNKTTPVAIHRAVQPGYWKQMARVMYPEEEQEAKTERARVKKLKLRFAPPEPTLSLRPLTVILDEYSMAPKKLVDRLVQILSNRGVPWRMIIGGDWRQLRPVKAHSIWTSDFAHHLMEVGCPVYNLDACNRRFAGCERMQQMNRAFLRNDTDSIMEWIATLASAKLPDRDDHAQQRYVAYSAKRLLRVNDAARRDLVKAGALTFTLMGGDGSALTFADGERVKVCKNVWDKESHEYSQRNGQKGWIEAGGLSGNVRVTADTRVRVRDPDGEGLSLIEPMPVGDGDDDEVPKSGQKRKRKRARYTFNRVLLSYTGFTVHSGQGDTMDPEDYLQVDLAGMPDIETIYTALSRHPRFGMMRVVGFDPVAVRRVLTLCPCGHDRAGASGQRCNRGEVVQRQKWINFLDTHTVHIARDDTLYFNH